MYKDWVLVRRLPEEADEINRRIAENIQQVTEENQEYIRSYHPAFKEASSVFVYFNPSSLSESVWIVHPAFARRNTFLLDNLSVACREVHPFEYISPLPRTKGTLLVHSSYNPYRDDPLRNLNPRVPLSKDDISVIRELWPSIIGVRIYVCGAISLLVHQWADVSEVTKYGWPSTIGGLLAQIESVEDIEPSVDKTPYALQDGTQRHSHTGTKQIGSTGLCIRGRFGPDENTVSDAIMTDTHSFVYTPSGMCTYYSLADVPIRKIIFDIAHELFFMIKIRVASTKACRALCSRPSVSWALTRLVGDTSSLEKDVYAGNQKVGKVTKCYDSPSLVFIYPFGYRHDLSLITLDGALPAITIPPGLPIIAGFEPTFDAVLRPGCPLFAARYCLDDTQTAGQPVPVQTSATQYTWEPGSESSLISRCLLWRSSNESDDTTGSVLCLGSCSLGVHETRVVAFQIFEVEMQYTQEAAPLIQGQKCRLRYKGGFSLPAEVFESQVVMQQQLGT